MTSSTDQLGTVHLGWLTVPLQVPSKAARPDAGGAVDGPTAARGVAGEVTGVRGAVVPDPGPAVEPDDPGPDSDGSAGLPCAFVGCGRAWCVGAAELCPGPGCSGWPDRGLA